MWGHCQLVEGSGALEMEMIWLGNKGGARPKNSKCHDEWNSLHMLGFLFKAVGKNFGMDCNYFDTIHPWKWQKWLGCAGILFPPTDYRYVWTSIELLHCPHSPAHTFSKQPNTYVCQTLWQVQHGNLLTTNRHSKSCLRRTEIQGGSTKQAHHIGGGI